MKVHQFTREFCGHEPFLPLGCKRVRPLAPKLSNTDTTTTSTPVAQHLIQLVETHPGGTRWNPTQEQIGIWEMLYRGGMRTPNAQQIEQITGQLRKYGQIEGKNVFNSFQNHRARERQKQRRNSLGLAHIPRTPTSESPIPSSITFEMARRDQEDGPYKKCWSWAFEFLTSWKTKAGHRAKRRNKKLWLFSHRTQKADEGV